MLRCCREHNRLHGRLLRGPEGDSTPTAEQAADSAAGQRHLGNVVSRAGCRQYRAGRVPLLSLAALLSGSDSLMSSTVSR